MFSSLLIANRGEISRLIMRTARRLGIRTVAVFSDADVDAAFVREAVDAPAEQMKKRASDKQEQGVNSPAMPIAWTRVFKNEAGKENKVFTTTMGAATDLASEGLRRLVVNGVFWALGEEVPVKADVTLVGSYEPLMYGFNGFRKDVKPSAHALEAGKP